jgi:aarF domain-containing kinase
MLLPFIIVALTGDPNYGIILQAYPFIARKLLQSDRPEIQTALQQVLYSGDSDSSSSGLKLSRLLALLNNAAGSVATQDGAVFVDIDTVPEDGISFQEGLQFLLSDNANSLRQLLEPEVDSIMDILTRQIFRRGVSEAVVALTPPRPPSIPFLGDILPPSPKLDEIPLPILLPAAEGGGVPRLSVLTLQQLTDAIAPRLSKEDELFALGLADAAKDFLGDEFGDLVRGENVLSAQSFEIVLSGLRSGVLGRADFLSAENVQTAVDFMSRAISSVRDSTSSSSREVETDLVDAVGSLDDVQRKRFDDIVQEVTRRLISRSLERLSALP